MTHANKILTLEPTFESTDEARVIAIDLSSRGGMYKFASSDALDYCAAVRPKPGKRYVLVLALSASEYYGPNRNGDAFAERPVMGSNGQWLLTKEEVLPVHHLSFVDIGHVFVHHVNKDPRKAYGKPIKSFYNWGMHRVELLVEIDLETSQGQFFMDRIDKGQSPAVSMGCRIKHDLCSICGNPAPTRLQYCEHVNNRNPDFGMNRLLDDGRRCFVWNPSPRFFDISFVWKPADPIGFMMKKVAAPYAVQTSRDAAEEVAELAETVADLRKVAEIDKVIQGELLASDVPQEAVHGDLATVQRFVRGVLPHIGGLGHDIPDHMVRETRNLPLAVIVSSMLHANIVPTARDMLKILAERLGHAPPDAATLTVVGRTQGALADALTDAPGVLALTAKHAAMHVDESCVDYALATKLAESMPGRNLALDSLVREYVPESVGVPTGELAKAVTGYDASNAYYNPASRTLNYTDKETGKTYQTTQHAAEKADLENKKKLAIEAGGTAGLLGVGYKTLLSRGNSKINRILAPAAAVGSAGVGYNVIRDQRVPRMKTQEGEYIPVNTELVQKNGSWVLPIGAGAATALTLAHDVFGQDPGSAVYQAHMFATDHPFATAGASGSAVAAGLMGAGSAKSGLKRAIGAITKRASFDPVHVGDDQLEEIGSAIGRVLAGSL